MIIDSIQNGIVIDHITAGKSMELYQILGLDQLDCTVAILKNVTSGKLGCKDIIKIDREMDLDWDLIGYVDPSITVNIIRDGKLLRVAVRGRKSGEFLELILSKPSAPKEGEKRPDEAAFWKSFSADEVRAYSKALGDHNEIHYTEKPVVSGFQIFESVMEEYPSDGMKISFHHPVFSGEEVYLMEKDQKIEGYTDQLCFVAVRS